MPGLVGLSQRIPEGGLEKRFARLLAPMVRGGRLQTETRVSGCKHWAIGRVHLGVFHPQSQLSSASPYKVIFHGELHNEAARASRDFAASGSQSQGGASTWLQHVYENKGLEGLGDVQGAFCAVLVDDTRKRLMLTNDQLGSYPLYWHANAERLVFASELKAVLRDPDIQAELNPDAVADYLSFGFLVGEKTIAKGVCLLPPGSTLTYDWRTGECRLKRNSKICSLFHYRSRDKGGYYEALGEAFNAAVHQCVTDNHQFGLALSGGMDSRAILSASRGLAKKITTYTLGVKGCADEVIADQLARLAGTRHQFLEMDAAYLGAFLPNLQRMVYLTDGMYMTHGLTEMLALQFVEKGGFDVLLRGHGAELAKVSLAWPLHTDAAIHGMTKKNEFIRYMLRRVNYISRGAPLKELFAAEWWKAIAQGAEQSLEQSLENVDLSPPDLCSYLYLMEHHRRFTIPSLELFRNHVEVNLPFVNWEFLKVLWSAPASWRDRTDIHRALIRKNHPALIKVRNSNTGAPGDAHPLLEAFCDKMNSLFKRLNVPGYRHYHAFEDWMKSSSIAAVEAVLLDAQTLGRGQYQRNTLKHMLEDTKSGRADYAYLFQILLILELWQRQCEGESGFVD